MDGYVGHQKAIPHFGGEQRRVADDAAVDLPHKPVGQSTRSRAEADHQFIHRIVTTIAEQLPVVSVQRFAKHQFEQFDNLPQVVGHIYRTESIPRACCRNRNGHTLCLTPSRSNSPRLARRPGLVGQPAGRSCGRYCKPGQGVSQSVSSPMLPGACRPRPV